MHLALWDRPPADCLRRAAERLGFLAECRDAKACARLLQDQQVDVALIPTTLALMSGEKLKVLPDVAVSSWSYPFVRIVLPHGVRNVQSIAYPASCAQATLLARIILQEHYGIRPFWEARSPEEIRGSEDGYLLVTAGEAEEDLRGTVLDVGQEWFELAQYPMVWGLFVTLAEGATPQLAAQVKALVREAEALAGTWPVAPSFYADSLRFRLDDVAMASLTRIREYLYFYKVTADLSALALYEVGTLDDHTPPWAAP